MTCHPSPPRALGSPCYPCVLKRAPGSVCYGTPSCHKADTQGHSCWFVPKGTRLTQSCCFFGSFSYPELYIYDIWVILQLEWQMKGFLKTEVAIVFSLLGLSIFDPKLGLNNPAIFRVYCDVYISKESGFSNMKKKT